MGALAGELADDTIGGDVTAQLFLLTQSSSAFLSEKQTNFLGSIAQQNGTTARLDPTGIVTGPAPFNADADMLVQCDPTANPIQVNLPFAFNRRGQSVTVANVSLVSFNTIHIVPQPGDSIRGITAEINTSAPGACVTLISDGGTNWDVTTRTPPEVTMAVETTDAVPKDLSIDGAGIPLFVPTDETWKIVAEVLATQTGGAAGTPGDSWINTLKIVAVNVAGVVTLHPGPLVPIPVADPAANFWAIAVTAVGAEVKITVTGEVNKTIRWKATLDITRIPRT